MWTPRRVGLLILGIAGFATAYLIYAQLLGALDGLPSLPAKYLRDATSTNFTYRPPAVPPYVQKLQDAFGLGSAEGGEEKVVYKTRAEFPDKDLVIAAGELMFDSNGNKFVPVSPLSLAIISRAKPLPGEMPDISTFHADKAILEFSQPVARMQDINNDKVKLVGIELISLPDSEGVDKRKGFIWITNNQKSPDPAEHIVVRTPGPVFYRVPEDRNAVNPEVAQVWTAAPVEVFDRKNLPRPLRFSPPRNDPRRRYAVPEVIENIPPVAALARPEDLRRKTAIADILLGSSLPPPTISAVGLKIFLNSNDPKTPSTPKPGKPGASNSGIRQLVLCERVQMNLWTEGDSGFPGETKSEAKTNAKPDQPRPDPTLALLAAVGTLADGIAMGERLQTKALMLIETPGAFRYDFEKEEARFDIATQAPPAGQSNFVTVTRLSATGAQDNLFCTTLTLDLSTPPQAATPPASSAKATATPRTSRTIRGLTATGQYVYISIESDGLTAQGTELRYATDSRSGKTITTLRGAPVIADRDGSRLQAGDTINEGLVVIETVEEFQQGKSKKTSTVQVRGPGRMELFDAEAPKDPKLAELPAATAKWGKSLTHTKDRLGGKDVDLLKFDGGGSFIDPRSDFTLTGDLLWLWLANKADDKSGRPALTAKGKPEKTGTGTVPERLVADGNVDVRSPELYVKNTDKLTVWFRDVAPPKMVPAPAPEIQPLPQPMAVLPATPLNQPAPKAPVIIPAGATEPKIAVAPEQEKAEDPPVPIQLTARVIESWVTRYPVPAAPAAKAAPGPALRPATPDDQPKSGKLKYELERALCEDRVHVQQDPTDPGQGLPGLDITGIKLELNHSPTGSVLRVFGTKTEVAVVQYEGLTLYGPDILIDQPNNYVEVVGLGRLKMQSSADLNGQQLDTPSDIIVNWTSRMQFWGAKAMAEFVAGVTVVQVVAPTAALQPGRPSVPGSRPTELAPAPKELADANPNTTRYELFCHRLDVTFDRPIYFNKMTQKKEKPKPNAPAKKEERPKLKTAVCTPMPEDELRGVAAAPLTAKDVFFREMVLKPDRTFAQARYLTAKQIDFTNSEKEQDMKASGPGELRILQAGSADDSDDPKAPKPVKPAKSDDDELKLTIVTFRKRMNAKDQAKVYQEATFPDGATVIRFPATVPNIRMEPHELPAVGVFLASEESLVVSASKTKPGAKAEQRLVATGNAQFKDKTYTGNGGKITYTSQQVVFDGTQTRLATLYHNKLGPNERQYHQAKQIIYRKDGSVSVTGSGGGALTPGG